MFSVVFNGMGELAEVGDVEKLGGKVVVVEGLDDEVGDVGEFDDVIVVGESLDGDGGGLDDEVSGVRELGGIVVVKRLDGEIDDVVGFANFGVDVGLIEDS